jgi:hypothetical protein
MTRAVPYDPLYVETPGGPALLQEFRVPLKVAVYIWRPDPAWLAAHDRRLDGYQLMALVSGAPDADEHWPQTWELGVEPYIWLARIRHGQDIAYGEIRPSIAEGVHCQVRWPVLLDGREVVVPSQEVVRASFGVKLLLGLHPVLGRVPDPVRYPNDVAKFRDDMLNAMERLFRRQMPSREITQPVVARAIGMGLRTMQRHMFHYRFSWDALKHEASQRAQSFHP